MILLRLAALMLLVILVVMLFFGCCILIDFHENWLAYRIDFSRDQDDDSLSNLPQ